MRRQLSWLHNRWPRSLRFRVAWPFVTLFFLILIGLYFFLGNAAESTQLKRLQDELHAQANVSAYVVARETDAGITDHQSGVMELSGRFDSRITLIDGNGVVFGESERPVAEMENHNDRPEVIAARETGFGKDRRTSDSTGDETLYVAVQVPESDGWIMRVAVPTAEVQEAVSSTERAILLAVAGSLLATIAAGWYLAGRLSRPLEHLMRQAMRISVGDFTVQVPPYDVREINNVGRAFNRMADRLAELSDRQEQTSLRLESVMGGLIDGVVLTDADGRVLRVNPAAERMLGVTEMDAFDKPFVQATRDYEMARVLNGALEGKEKSTATVEHGVEHQFIQVQARVIEGAQQRLGLVVLRDVTDVRRLETVRREFVANVSHELRTPLTSIRALVETLEAGAVEEPELAMDFLQRIIGEIDRLNTLVEDLLDFARLEAGRTPLRLEYVDVGTVLETGAKRLSQQIERAGLTIEVVIDENLPEMAIDVGRIEQVLINLIHNAIKFTPSGGELYLRGWREKNTVYVSLRDTGIGIPEDEQTRLFERFYKSDKARRSDGTGLGLAIAQNIVKLHGGKISVKSTPGEGSEFVFSLPMKQKKAARRARKHELKGLL